MIVRSRYYYAGSTRVAMRTGSSTLNYLLGDHLGSQAITTDSNGNRTGEIRYNPWGTERYSSGTTPTTYHFTGQRLESALGLYYYGARWYDPYLNRWIQPDTIIPDPFSSQDWDRYAYVRNNPVRYTDPSGHMFCDSDGRCAGIKTFTRGLDVIKNRAGKGVPWNQLSDDEKSALTWVGETPGSYGDIANTSNEDVTWSLEDPFNQAYWSLVGFITAFKAIPQAVTTIGLYLCGNDGDCTNEFDIGSHALQRMAERGISIDQLQNALLNNEPFKYFHDGQWKLGYYDEISKVFVAVLMETRTILTVINNTSPNYIENLKKLVGP